MKGDFPRLLESIFSRQKFIYLKIYISLNRHFEALARFVRKGLDGGHYLMNKETNLVLNSFPL